MTLTTMPRWLRKVNSLTSAPSGVFPNGCAVTRAIVDLVVVIWGALAPLAAMGCRDEESETGQQRSGVRSMRDGSIVAFIISAALLT